MSDTSKRDFSKSTGAAALAIIALTFALTAFAQTGRTYKESRPSREPLPKAPAGAPNVIYLVLDDVGFAQLGCYGSEISTPNLDKLAANGLRYNNFHTTTLCSPSRAALLTGHPRRSKVR